MCKDVLLVEYTWFVRNYVRHLTLLKEKRKNEGRPEDKKGAIPVFRGIVNVKLERGRWNWDHILLVLRSDKQ